MIKAKKRYGQNFLKNKEILKNISNSVDIKSNDLIIEIGPGMGALTEFLFNKNSYLLCYEIDTSLSSYLDKYNSNRSKVIYGDFLNRDISEDIKGFKYENIYVIANIPYYITTKILLKLLDFKICKSIVLLVQKEYGQRIVAKEKTKEYNALTLLVDYSYNSEIIMKVLKNEFMPVPKVDSVVVKLDKKKTLDIDKEFYQKFIREAFRNKRKTLKNNLENYDWNLVLKVLNELNYNENVRAEEIKKADFVEIARIMSNFGDRK